MFEQTILAGANRGRRFWTACLGMTGEALLVASAVIAPMVWPQVLPRPQNWIGLYTPSVPPPPTRNLDKPRTTRVEPTRAANLPRPFTAPVSIPPRAAILTDPPVELAPVGVPGSVDTRGVLGASGGIDLSSLLAAGRPVPLVRAPEPRAASASAREPEREIPRVRLGGQVDPAKLLYRVEPRYPALAKQARISGVVELECVIDIDGHMREVAVRRGHPLLVGAAVEAVRQWIYQPTRLNGQPVEVIAPVTVTFRLAE
jgi:periplasmic protein TonB